MYHNFPIRQAKEGGLTVRTWLSSTSHETVDSLSYGICDRSEHDVIKSLAVSSLSDLTTSRVRLRSEATQHYKIIGAMRYEIIHHSKRSCTYLNSYIGGYTGIPCLWNCTRGM
ncbi:MAG: hypothetical protein ACQEWW_19485 [Bacillota bacterium]